MSNEANIERIEITIEQAEAQIALADKLEALHRNDDFQELIVQGYFKDEASRAVLLKGDPEMASELDQKQLDLIIIGIGALRQYFHKVYSLGEMAKRSIEADKQTREDMLAEDLRGETVQ